jgi:hypothetical protein
MNTNVGAAGGYGCGNTQGQLPPALQGWLSQVAANPNGGQDMAQNIATDFQNLQQAKAAAEANPDDPQAQQALQDARTKFHQDKQQAEAATGLPAPHRGEGLEQYEQELAQAQATGLNGMFQPGMPDPNGGGVLA